LPKAARYVARAFRRTLPKIWASESDRFDPRRRTFDLDLWRKGWLRAAREGLGNRVTYPFAAAVIEVLYDLARTGKGYAVETMERIGEVAGCCADTVRKVVRDGETDGFLDSYNRTERPTKGKLKGMVIRGANQYIPIMPADDLADARAAAPDSAEAILPSETVSPEQAWLGRVARQIKRGERLFRLAGRRLGLNLTPLRSAPA
jgi:hypothetical protein